MKKQIKDPRLAEVSGPDYWQRDWERRNVILQLAREWIDGNLKLDAEERSKLQGLVYQYGPPELVSEFYMAHFRFNIGKVRYPEERLMEFEYDWLLVVLAKFPYHGGSQDRLLEICIKLKRLPDLYWEIFYRNGMQRVNKPELPDYTRRIRMLTQAIELAPGEADMKSLELVRLNGFHDFLQRIIPHPFPGDIYLPDGGYQFEAIGLIFMQVKFEEECTMNRLLADAGHWLAVQALESDSESPRQPIPFQRLTAEEIDFDDFIGLKVPQETESERLYQTWGKLKSWDLGEGVLVQMFNHSYAPQPADFPFFEDGMTEEEVHAIAIKRLLEHYIFASIEDVRGGSVRIYSLSTNTSRVFDAGHEGDGARFWAIHNREKKVLSFLIASMTD